MRLTRICLIVNEESSEDSLTVNGETSEDMIDFATDLYHASAHFSGNEVPIYVNLSSDEEEVSRTPGAVDMRFKGIHEQPNLTTLERISTKRHARAICLHEFKMGRTAAETARKINDAFGPGIAGERTVQYWFQKFRQGDESLADEDRRGRSLEVDQDELPIHCVKCAKLFKSTSQLWEHMSTKHLKERYRVCGKCGQKFISRSGLKRHVQVVHEHVLYTCPCKGCGHPGYRCRQALAVHVRTVHANIRAYVCETCGLSFYERNELKMHRLTHICKRVYQCLCGSTFRYKAGLENHQRLCLLH
ncbi:hypothetical protein KIN20_038403 [Parelaphostrongylus tenuis]|uniref:C2H2-type domain-containing protein n=1 Tax=Parelaphostrongylus tenuis TaxID=148309 RepID=A0AAD5QL39_PARTN|nr:hypothetical protein KIN20_038403 [Parelaphostrongylus tenuis]